MPPLFGTAGSLFFRFPAATMDLKPFFSFKTDVISLILRKPHCSPVLQACVVIFRHRAFWPFNKHTAQATAVQISERGVVYHASRSLEFVAIHCL